jgi:signal transduction histidine kinase
VQRFIFLILFFLSIVSTTNAQNTETQPKLKLIQNLLDEANNRDNELNQRLEFGLKANRLAKETKIDSIILKSNRALSTIYLYSGEYDIFRDINFKNIKLADKLQDTLALAIANQNLGFYNQLNVINDSAYYYYSNASKLYDKINNIKGLGEVLMSIASIQELERDYLGSEENTIKAIELMQQLPQDNDTNYSLWLLNRSLGSISLKLKAYDKSLEYYQRALNISKKIENGLLSELSTKNSIAFAHKEKGDLKTALRLYEEVLNTDKFFEIDPAFYALVLDNVTFTKFLIKDYDKEALETSFQRAYKISDSLEDVHNKIYVSIDMAKFYKELKVKDSALKYANVSYKLSKETSTNEILLESMLLLSELNEGEKGKKFLKEHIHLNDSLLANERSFRNKFARIKFETEQIELENERISRERFWLLMISIVLITTLVLLYVVITQRAKNKELKFAQDQQKTNEEIYNLMLSQQDKVDEARAREKVRISQELHDGILGRLFGTRLSLDSLNFVEGKDAIFNRANYIKELKLIEEDIRKISHDLNTDFVSGSGFMDILTELIENQTQAYNLQHEFKFTDDINWEIVPNKTKINIYRIIQESMQNIYKHANASLVKISIQQKNNVICLTIIDDGDGFLVNKSKKGIGLKNIHSRVNEINGDVHFESELKSGTTITINIPYVN